MSTENIPGATAAGSKQTTDDGIDMSVEARARRLGWHPKEEYNGAPGKWVDAAEFVRRGEEQMPLLRENLRKTETRALRLESQLGAQGAQLNKMQAELEEARQAVVDMRDMLSTSQDRAYQRAISEIEARFDAAIDEGDKAAAKKAREDLKVVTEEMAKRTAKKAEKKDPPAAPEVQPNQEAVAWVNDPSQAWYRGNLDAKVWADAVFSKMGADPAVKDLPLSEKLSKIRELAAKKFPEYFPANDPLVRQPEKKVGDAGDDDDEVVEEVQHPKVSTPRSPRRQQAGAQTFDAMPQEAKDSYARIAKQITERMKHTGRGKPITKEEFATKFWENQ